MTGAMRRAARGFQAVVMMLACGVSVAACAFLTATDGLSGGDPGRSGDASASTAGDASTAGSDASSLVDALGQVTGDAGIADGSSSACTADAACQGTESCVGGRCLAKPVVVGRVSSGVAGFAVIGAELYIAEGGRVLRQPLDGGVLTKVSDIGALGQVSADATSLYLPSNGEIWRQPLAGGAATLVHSQNDSPITSVGVVGAELFYATPPPTLPGPTALYSLVTSGASTPQLRGSGFTFAEGLHVAEGQVFVADRLKGAIWTVPAAGGAPTVLLSVPGAVSVFAERSFVWIASSDDEAVYRTAIDGTGALEPIALGQSALTQIVVTAGAVYWAAGSAVLSVPR